MFLFRIENSANLLWINSDSLYNVNEAWLSENFQKNQRQQVIIVEGDNVLNIQSINKVSGNIIYCFNVNRLIYIIGMDQSISSLSNFKYLPNVDIVYRC